MKILVICSKAFYDKIAPIKQKIEMNLAKTLGKV